VASIGEPWCATSDPTIGKHFGASSGGPETGLEEITGDFLEADFWTMSSGSELEATSG
jgi:hypothetical protein